MLKNSIGVKASLIIDAGLYKGTYASKVEDVEGDSVGLAHPLMRGALLPVHRNVQMKMRVEMGGALYFSLVSITKGIVRGEIPLLWVTPVGEADKIQRRHFVRVPCLLKVGLFRLEGEGYRPEKEEWAFVTAKDISLGGIGFAVLKSKGEAYAEESRYVIEFFLQETKIMLAGKIVKKMPKDDVFDIGVAFDSVPASVEKALGRFIRQQELAGRQS